MGSGRTSIGHSERIFCNDEVQRIAKVRKRCPHHLDVRSISSTTASLEARDLDVVDKVLGDELIDQLQSAVVPNLR
jgi:hypothetical protein